MSWEIRLSRRGWISPRNKRQQDAIDQAFVQMFRLISLIAAGMALLAGALAWFIIHPAAARGKQAAPQPSLAP